MNDWYYTLARVSCEKNGTEYGFNLPVFTRYPLTNKQARAEMATKILNTHKVEGAKKVKFDKSIVWRGETKNE